MNKNTLACDACSGVAEQLPFTLRRALQRLRRNKGAVYPPSPVLTLGHRATRSCTARTLMRSCCASKASLVGVAPRVSAPVQHREGNVQTEGWTSLKGLGACSVAAPAAATIVRSVPPGQCADKYRIRVTGFGVNPASLPCFPPEASHTCF